MSVPANQPITAAVAKEQLTDAIRNWTHMNNLYEHHSAQANNARSLRAQHEAEVIRKLHELNMERSTIRVTGATLKLAVDTTPAPITWGLLEKEVPAWAAHTGLPSSKAAELIRWLQANRGAKERECLKKTPDVVGGSRPKKPAATSDGPKN